MISTLSFRGAKRRGTCCSPDRHLAVAPFVAPAPPMALLPRVVAFVAPGFNPTSCPSFAVRKGGASAPPKAPRRKGALAPEAVFSRVVAFVAPGFNPTSCLSFAVRKGGALAPEAIFSRAQILLKPLL